MLSTYSYAQEDYYGIDDMVRGQISLQKKVDYNTERLYNAIDDVYFQIVDSKYPEVVKNQTLKYLENLLDGVEIDYTDTSYITQIISSYKRSANKAIRYYHSEYLKRENELSAKNKN